MKYDDDFRETRPDDWAPGGRFAIEPRRVKGESGRTPITEADQKRALVRAIRNSTSPLTITPGMWLALSQRYEKDRRWLTLWALTFAVTAGVAVTAAVASGRWWTLLAAGVSAGLAVVAWRLRGRVGPVR